MRLRFLCSYHKAIVMGKLPARQHDSYCFRDACDISQAWPVTVDAPGRLPFEC